MLIAACCCRLLLVASAILVWRKICQDHKLLLYPLHKLKFKHFSAMMFLFWFSFSTYVYICVCVCLHSCLFPIGLFSWRFLAPNLFFNDWRRFNGANLIDTCFEHCNNRKSHRCKDSTRNSFTKMVWLKWTTPLFRLWTLSSTIVALLCGHSDRLS